MLHYCMGKNHIIIAIMLNTYKSNKRGIIGSSQCDIEKDPGHGVLDHAYIRVLAYVIWETRQGSVGCLN